MLYNPSPRLLRRPSQRDANYPRLSGSPREEARPCMSDATSQNTKKSKACLSCRARPKRNKGLYAVPCKHCNVSGIQRVLAANRRKSGRTNPSPLSAQITNVAALEPKEQKAHAASSGKAHEVVKGLILYSPVPRFPSFIKPLSFQIEQHQLDFLRSEGALSLPDRQTQRAMVEAFAVFAFPYLPIVDLGMVLKTLQGHETSQTVGSIGLLLYQAILYAGSSFVDTNHFRAGGHGFGSRMSARVELSRRITLLYDLGCAPSDSVEMIQVALIMASGSETIGDWKNSWYWMGQAISLALVMKLNREGACSLDEAMLSEQRLRRRIWWTCYLRDRFLSLSINRAARIKDADCMLAPLALNDFDFVTIKAEPAGGAPGASSYMAVFEDRAKQVTLAEICVHRIRLAQVIDIVTSVQQAYDRSEDEIAAAEASGWLDRAFSKAEGALEYWLMSLPPSCVYRKTQSLERSSEPVVVNRDHLHMAFHTLRYTLHRPRFLPTSLRRRDPTAKLSSDISGARTISSAIHISLITRELDHLGLVGYLPVSGVTVIFPAIAISLLEIKSASTIQQQWAAQRFMICFKAMETLRETYQTAGVAMDYLVKALQAASLTLDDVVLKAGRYDERALVTDFMETWHPALLLDESITRDHEILGGIDAYLHREADPFRDGGSALIPPKWEFWGTTCNKALKVEEDDVDAAAVLNWTLGIGDSVFKGLEQMV